MTELYITRRTRLMENHLATLESFTALKSLTIINVPPEQRNLWCLPSSLTRLDLRLEEFRDRQYEDCVFSPLRKLTSLTELTLFKTSDQTDLQALVSTNLPSVTRLITLPHCMPGAFPFFIPPLKSDDDHHHDANNTLSCC